MTAPRRFKFSERLIGILRRTTTETKAATVYRQQDSNALLGTFKRDCKRLIEAGYLTSTKQARADRIATDCNHDEATRVTLLKITARGKAALAQYRTF